MALRHLETGKVVATRPPCPAASAKQAAWDLWHEGEALRTDYLAELAAELGAQREQEEAARREEAARQVQEWERTQPEREARAAAEAAEHQARHGFVVASGIGWELRVHKRGTIYVNRMDWGLRVESDLVGELQVYADRVGDAGPHSEIRADDSAFCSQEDAAYTFGATRAEAEAAAVAMVPRVLQLIEAAWLAKWSTSKKGNPWMRYGEWRLVVVPASTGDGARLLMTHLVTETDLKPWPYESQCRAQLGAMSMLVKAPRLLEIELRRRRH